MNTMIELKGIDKFYQLGQSKIQVLHDVYLKIQSNDFVSVMGPSGSGKSTLINILGFLDHDYDGDYQFKGSSVTQLTDDEVSKLRNQTVGFIFQEFNLIESMTVQENVQLPLIYAGQSPKTAKDKVVQVLEKVSLSHKLKARPYELSGGQRQRVAIARALVNDPSFIIADEPTGALDTKTSRDIMDILSHLHREEGATIIMVTHDPGLQSYANKHIVIVDGRVKEVRPDEAQDYIHAFRQMNQEKEERE